MQQMLNTAFKIAAIAHDGQFDKAGKPYLTHILRVYQNLNSNDEGLNCIAALHDTIEDTKLTYQELRDAGMTERVINGVRLLTKVPGQTADEYLEGILSSRDAMLVKKADLTDNMDIKRLKGVSDKDMARMNKYILMYHEIETKLAEPEIVPDWEAPEDFKIIDNPGWEAIAGWDVVEGFKEGDQVRFKHTPRNAFGDENPYRDWDKNAPQSFNDLKDIVFTLGLPNDLNERYDGTTEDWIGFDIDQRKIGPYPWGWVRSDDIEKVEL